MKRLIPALLLAPALMAAPALEQSFTLPNGLRVVLLEDHTLPQARVHLAQDFEAQGGLASFTGALLEGAGAGPFNAAAFAHALEERGAWLQSTWRPGTLEWRLQVGSSEIEGAMELLGHAVFRSTYEASRVERVRARMLRQVQERSPREAAIDRFQGALGHPAGGRLASEADLRRITLQELLAFRRGLADPRKALLVIQGDLSPALARQVTLQAFGTWTPPSSPLPMGPQGLPPLSEVRGLPVEAWGARRMELSGGGGWAAFDLLAEVFALRSAAGAEPLRLEWVRGDRLSGMILARGSSLAELKERLGALVAQGLTQAELDRAQEILRRDKSMLALHPQKLVEDCLDRNRLAKADGAGELHLAQVKSLLEAWLKPDGMHFLVVKGE